MVVPSKYQYIFTSITKLMMNIIFSDTTFWCGRQISQRKKHLIDFGIRVFFSSLLMAFDIGPDSVTAIDFLNSRDLGWAAFTFAIICTPWWAKIFVSLSNLRICFTKTVSQLKFSNGGYYIWKKDMMDSLLEFPLFQPFRWIAF